MPFIPKTTKLFKLQISGGIVPDKQFDDIERVFKDFNLVNDSIGPTFPVNWLSLMSRFINEDTFRRLVISPASWLFWMNREFSRII